ncbi:MAG: TCR/Tet family MFS transporter [Proteobacteria bacterium]|nr:TCR/Tet family MFS transporter [Pseudomonadota bacterium]
MIKKNRAASLKFIFATIFLDALGIGLLIPVFPDVIRRFSSNPEFVNQYFGFFISIYALMQFLASPVLGSLSDRYGRRIVLLNSLLFAGLDYILMAFAPTLSILFVGRILSGLTGASMTVASSYMADISDDSNRSANFGMIGAAFGLGFIIGPALGGVIGELGPQAPFLAAAFLNLLNFAFGYFVLPESLPEKHRRQIVISKLNPFSSLLKIIKPSSISILVWVYALINLGGQSHPSIWTLYTQYKFGWSSFQVGLSLSFVGLVIAFSQGYLTRIIIPKLGEAKSILFGNFFYMLGFGLFAFATQGWMMYAIMAIFSLSGVAIPAIQSMISKKIPPHEQGELQGSLISIASLTAIVGPIIYTNLFAHFTRATTPIHFPGISYFAASMICLLAIILLLGKKPWTQHI